MAAPRFASGWTGGTRISAIAGQLDRPIRVEKRIVVSVIPDG